MERTDWCVVAVEGKPSGSDSLGGARAAIRVYGNNVYVIDVVGLANEQVRKSMNVEHQDDNCEPWLPVGLPMVQQSKWAAQLMNLAGWENKSHFSYTHVVDHEFNLKPGESRTVSIEPADDSRVLGGSG